MPSGKDGHEHIREELVIAHDGLLEFCFELTEECTKR
jgi:hypothetical protein